MANNRIRYEPQCQISNLCINFLTVEYADLKIMTFKCIFSFLDMARKINAAMGKLQARHIGKHLPFYPDL